MDSDLELPVSLLVEGFVALSAEYKHLAAQHQSLERRLARSQQECNHLRELCQDKTAAATSSSLQDPSETEVKASLPLAEWIENIRRGSRSGSAECVARVKQAETACVQIQNKLTGTEGGCPFNVSLRRPSGPPHPAKPLYTPALNTIPDMEEDFTTPGAKSGTLNCPFAGIGTPTQEKDRMPPTPRSSRTRSHVSSGRPRGSRASYHDPLNPSVAISADGSRTTSIAGSGPACPIRFLGQHSPEEIAKYFQEHKHELPRSHEVCVKRFSDTPEDAKKLDAKYGSLVNMIQGLGQKHRPMLPTVPVLDDDDIEYDEARGREAITRWAKSVDEEIKVEGSEDVDTKVQAVSEPLGQAGAEERVPHFDRPLREVRVGESPSRPWGVPIPLKYLEREPDTGSTRLDGGTTLASREPDSAVEDAAAAITSPPADAVAKPAEDSRPRGKCPFGHGAAAGGPQELPPPSRPQGDERAQHLSVPEVPKPVIRHASSVAVSRPKKYAEEPARETAGQNDTRATVELAEQQGQGNEITNHGIMVMARGTDLKELRITNRGTILVGLDSASVKELISFQRSS